MYFFICLGSYPTMLARLKHTSLLMIPEKYSIRETSSSPSPKVIYFVLVKNADTDTILLTLQNI
jgi:hypothetical protein